MHVQIAGFNELKPKFPYGSIVATPNALRCISQDEFIHGLQRHIAGDWGTLEPEDWSANEHALETGGRLFSVYYSSAEQKFWIITEADRSVTTVRLPEDY